MTSASRGENHGGTEWQRVFLLACGIHTLVWVSDKTDENYANKNRTVVLSVNFSHCIYTSIAIYIYTCVYIHVYICLVFSECESVLYHSSEKAALHVPFLACLFILFEQSCLFFWEA